MNGTQKQIDYAMSLIETAISTKITESETATLYADRYELKPRDGKSQDVLARRDEMIAEYRAQASGAMSIVDTLRVASTDNRVSASTMIDCCNGKWFDKMSVRNGRILAVGKKFKQLMEMAG